MIVFAVAAYLQAQLLPEPETAPLVKPDDEPDVVCTMAPVTGARAKKQKVCKTPRYEKGGEAWRHSIRAIQRGGGNAQPQPGG